MSAPRTPAHGRRAGLAALLFTTIFIASCASQTGARGDFYSKTNQWTGRLSLTLASEPPQSFFASFDLSGNPQAGELTLTSPIGSTLAVMQWQPGEAMLRQGGQTRHYESIDTLAQEVTGTPLPVRALFGWLRGDAQTVPGWQADLSQLPQGRLQAQRLTPWPTAQLRVILDR